MSDSLKRVLVHLDSTPGSSVRLQAARDIAAQHGSAITALYAVAPCIADMPYSGDMTGSVAQSLALIDSERLAAARAAFERVLEAPGPMPAWSELDEFPVAGAFVQQAFYADLLVLGQPDPAQRYATSLPADFNQSVILASGKPALIIPYIGGFKPAGETVLIAWKETREAARALTASLPLLRQARKIHVIAWGAEPAPRIKGPHLDLEDYLRLHGLQAEIHLPGPEPESIGEMLLSRASDFEADLIVMGCYGHSRARELVLGGASRSILKSMTMPVLMAH
ncbi:MAG: universal stress protein [Pseudomonadota bacterium]